jgi:hypothetical protein
MLNILLYRWRERVGVPDTWSIQKWKYLVLKWKYPAYLSRREWKYLVHRSTEKWKYLHIKWKYPIHTVGGEVSGTYKWKYRDTYRET